MKKLTFLIAVTLFSKIMFAQDTDISNLPASVPYTKQIPGNSKRATTHGEFAYDTISFIIINKYGLNLDTVSGQYLDDVYDTLYVQRKASFGYTLSGTRDQITYKLLNK